MPGVMIQLTISAGFFSSKGRCGGIFIFPSLPFVPVVCKFQPGAPPPWQCTPFPVCAGNSSDRRSPAQASRMDWTSADFLLQSVTSQHKPVSLLAGWLAQGASTDVMDRALFSDFLAFLGPLGIHFSSELLCAGCVLSVQSSLFADVIVLPSPVLSRSPSQRVAVMAIINGCCQAEPKAIAGGFSIHLRHLISINTTSYFAEDCLDCLFPFPYVSARKRFSPTACSILFVDSYLHHVNWSDIRSKEGLFGFFASL